LYGVKEPNSTHTTPAEIAAKYNVHRSTITRRMGEIGIFGQKIGPNPKSPLRYTDDQVDRLQQYLASMPKGGSK